MTSKAEWKARALAAEAELADAYTDLSVAQTESDIWQRRAEACEAKIPPEPTTQKGVSVGGDFQNWPASDRARYLDAMKAAGCGWIRVDFNCGNPDPAVFVANGAWTRDMDVLGVLIARDRVLTPMEMAAFAGQMAKDQPVDAWEVWNEPNLSSFWPSPDPAKYAAVYNAAKQAIHNVRPDVTVVTGGLSPAPNSASTIAPADFLSRALAAGMEPDAIGWHPYCSPAYPYEYPAWSAWEQMRQTPTWKAGKIPFWLTEFGAPTGGVGDSAIVNEGAQEDMIAAAFDEMNRPQDGPLFIYQGRDKGTGFSREDHYGLLRADWSEKPAYQAFKEA